MMIQPFIFSRFFRLFALSLSVCSLAYADESNDAENQSYHCNRLLDSIPKKPTLAGDVTDLKTMHLSAQELQYWEASKQAILLGDVFFQQANKVLRADKLIYAHETETLTAEGNVTAWDDFFVIQSQQVGMSKNEVGSALLSHYWLQAAHGKYGRGQAKRLEKQSDKMYLLEDISYTSCPPDKEIWRLESAHARLDFDREVAVARDVKFKLYDTTVAYTPYMRFPLSNKRESGLLQPTLGNSSTSGFDLSLPYYFNFAPNYDATLTPRIMSKRGLLLQTEFRYLTPQMQGDLDWGYLPNDHLFDDDRLLVKFKHQGQLNGRWSTNLRYEETSDRHYFEDMGTTLEVSSTTHLEQHADLRYIAPNYRFLGRAQSFQTLDPNPQARPYERMPQFLVESTLPERNHQLNTHAYAEWVRFDRNTDVIKAPIGNRFDVFTELSYPHRHDAGFFVPKIALNYTTYDLDPDHLNAGMAANPDRLLPIISADAGLYFERPSRWRGQALLHSLEPRIFYRYAPHKDQDDFPLFDTAEYDLSFSQLFRDRRFTGADRIGDDHFVSLAVTNRFLQQNNGRELLRASIGQQFYFSERAVFLPDYLQDNNDASSIMGELATEPSNKWRLAYNMRWSPYSNQTEQNAVHLRYHPGKNRIINVSYRFNDPRRLTNNLQEQADISWYWPLHERWRLMGRWNYSLQHHTSLETFAGLEYDTCCWAMRVVGRRYLKNLEGEYQNGLFFQVELKGLGGAGKKTSSFLREQIPGFDGAF